MDQYKSVKIMLEECKEIAKLQKTWNGYRTVKILIYFYSKGLFCILFRQSTVAHIDMFKSCWSYSNETFLKCDAYTTVCLYEPFLTSYQNKWCHLFQFNFFENIRNNQNLIMKIRKLYEKAKTAKKLTKNKQIA